MDGWGWVTVCFQRWVELIVLRRLVRLHWWQCGVFGGWQVHLYGSCRGMCGSVRGVCGLVMFNVVPTLAMAMVTMSAVEVVVVVIDVIDDMHWLRTG